MPRFAPTPHAPAAGPVERQRRPARAYAARSAEPTHTTVCPTRTSPGSRPPGTPPRQRTTPAWSRCPRVAGVNAPVASIDSPALGTPRLIKRGRGALRVRGQRRQPLVLYLGDEPCVRDRAGAVRRGRRGIASRDRLIHASSPSRTGRRLPSRRLRHTPIVRPRSDTTPRPHPRPYVRPHAPCVLPPQLQSQAAPTSASPRAWTGGR
jgi:hypothetical protein